MNEMNQKRIFSYATIALVLLGLAIRGYDRIKHPAFNVAEFEPEALKKIGCELVIPEGKRTLDLKCATYLVPSERDAQSKGLSAYANDLRKFADTTPIRSKDHLQATVTAAQATVHAAEIFLGKDLSVQQFKLPSAVPPPKNQ